MNSVIFHTGFKTPLGILTIAGLHVLPVWLYGYQHEVLSHALYAPYWIQTLGILVLAAGRLLCFAVEVRSMFTQYYHKLWLLSCPHYFTVQ